MVGRTIWVIIIIIISRVVLYIGRVASIVTMANMMHRVKFFTKLTRVFIHVASFLHHSVCVQIVYIVHIVILK